MKIESIYKILLSFLFVFWGYTNPINAQVTNELNPREKAIITIPALTAQGDLEQLKGALTDGLDAGLTINEIKEAMVHLYAYAGFPRSIRGLQTFITVLDERKAREITDVEGRAASTITDSRPKYDRGKENLETLIGAKLDGPQKGYAQFSPEIEVFLKEHLFADIFERDVLNFRQREMVTVAALIGIGEVEPMLHSHMNICLVQGVTPDQLQHLIKSVSPYVSKDKQHAAQGVLDELLASKNLPNTGIESVLGDENKTADMMFRISEIEVHPEYLDKYHAILKEEAAASVRLEPGVIVIFPLFQKENKAQFRILEIYASREAYQSHLQTPHFKTYKESTLKMVKSLKLVDMDALDKETMQTIFKK